MLGKTHRAGGCAAALITFEVMRTQGWLLPDVSDVIQLAMMYPLASWGSILPDLDHGPDTIPSKDPLSYLINWVLRKTGAKHRSWQTHSIYFTGVILFILYLMVFVFNAILGVQDNVGWAYIRLATVGLIAGVSSHLFLDALSTGGIYLLPNLKIRLVPKSSAFATGGLWEKIVFNILILIIVLVILKIFIFEINPDIIEDIIYWLNSLKGQGGL